MNIKEMLQIIASLCHLSSSGSAGVAVVDWPELVAAYQLSCQKYYVNCIRDSKTPGDDIESRMMVCILNKGYKQELRK